MDRLSSSSHPGSAGSLRALLFRGSDLIPLRAHKVHHTPLHTIRIPLLLRRLYDDIGPVLCRPRVRRRVRCD